MVWDGLSSSLTAVCGKRNFFSVPLFVLFGIYPTVTFYLAEKDRILSLIVKGWFCSIKSSRTLEDVYVVREVYSSGYFDSGCRDVCFLSPSAD